MEEEEKPKKPKSKLRLRYPGMKKLPKVGQPRKPKKKYGDMSLFGKIKPGQSDYQKRTMESFLKVREGETLEQWRVRTRRRRVKEIDEVNELSQYHPLRIMQRNRSRNAIKNKNKFIVVQPVEREFDFMKFYGIVSNYYITKYGIRKHDIEVGFYFYDNIPFTRDRFENACIMMTGTSFGRVRRAINEGLVEEIIHRVKVFNREDKLEPTGLYRLTKEFVTKLTHMYRTLGKMNIIRINQPSVTVLDPELRALIQEMNDEIVDIQMGNKPQELIVTNK